MSTQKIDITPDKSLMKKLGKVGYKTEEALAELIDNSIDARLDEFETIQVTIKPKEKTIQIIDDGHGMDFDELKSALTLAKHMSKDEETLGSFGLGMKSACSYLGKTFKITTAKSNSQSIFSAHYDEDEWMNNDTKTWKNFEITKEPNNTSLRGTKIEISNVKIPLYPNQLSTLREKFSIRYGPYLKNKQIIIIVNTKICKYSEPNLQQNTKRFFKINLPLGRQINGWIGLKEKRSIKGDYGIHIYKNNRLIKAFDKFGIRNHPTVAAILGEISLDHVPVNFQKMSFVEESHEYIEAQQYFKREQSVMDILKEATQQMISPMNVSAIFEWKHGIPANISISPRVSTTGAKLILQNFKNFTIYKNSKKIHVEFEDMVDGVYDIIKSDNSIILRINKTSNLFQIFKNPLFFLGLIQIEAESMILNPNFHNLVQQRNKIWTEFVNQHLPKSKIKTRIKHTKNLDTANYSLDHNLLNLYYYLNDNFKHDFQFTGISTLYPWLHNAYNKIIYNIQTTNGVSQELYETIRNFTSELQLLIEPTPDQLNYLIHNSSDTQFLIIREYAESLNTTWASPEKAWIDLYSETIKHKLTIYQDELLQIFESLDNNDLINHKKLFSIARHKKILEEIRNLVNI